MKTCLPVKGSPTYFAVLRSGLWHIQREFENTPGRNCFCTFDDSEPETEEKYLEDQIITCIQCQIGLTRWT